jgi:signal-transduction protein with cAMP-binding, CBS, and nucleotidyltransferase domain
MKVREIVARPAVTAGPETTIIQAATLMGQHGVGSVVITDHDSVTGIVTDRDLVTRAIAHRIPLDGRVDSVMSMNVVAIDADADVRDAMAAFSHHAVRRLPVLDGTRVIGLLALDDVISAFAGQFNDVTKGLTAQLLFPHGADRARMPALR